MSNKQSVTNRLDAQRVEALIDARFPQIHAAGRILTIEHVGPQGTRVRMKLDERNTRPGGTMSGAAMFTLADFSVYVAVIGALGERGVDAVTTNMSINFLAKPEARDMIADVRLIRIGRRLAVAEVELRSEGAAEMVAHAVASYAVPPEENHRAGG
jgi:uncharacterized protein (TIGR00369 family)